MPGMPPQGPQMHSMGYHQAGGPQFMGGPQNAPPYGAPYPYQGNVPQQYGSQPYGYSQPPAQQYVPTAAIPPQPAMTLPSLPVDNSVARPPPPPPGVDPPRGRNMGGGIDSGLQPQIVATSSLLEQRNKRGNGPGMSDNQCSGLC